MVRTVRRCLVVAFAALLAGCATQASVEATRISRAGAEFERDITACQAKAEASAEYREVGAFLPPLDGRKQASLAQLSNPQVPTVEQAAALTGLYNGYLRPCYDMGIERSAAIDAGVSAILGQSLSLGTMAYARLASRQITWGQYAEFTNQLRAELIAALNRRGEQVNDRLQAQHNRELDSRSAAFARASATMNQWQMVNAGNRQRSTSCNVVGSYLNCTTY